MKLTKQSFRIVSPNSGTSLLHQIETMGRLCYKSEDKISDNSAEAFVSKLISSKHEAMIEHASIAVIVICDRGISHEIVRHRIASYAQESTRYCNYSKDKFNSEITFILPEWFEYCANTYNHSIRTGQWEDISLIEKSWCLEMQQIERTYLYLIRSGWNPQQARSVLPNSLKTEIGMTLNCREWRHFFNMRASKYAHPQMQEIAYPMLEAFQKFVPVLFDDLDERRAI